MNNCMWFVVIERLLTVNPGFERVNMGDLSDLSIADVLFVQCYTKTTT